MFVCNNCGNEFVKWQGQCNFCKERNSLVEFKESKKTKTSSKAEKKEILSISENSSAEKRLETSSKELNNLLSGGFVESGVTLLSGEPGIGKSTLTLQLANWIKNKKILYVSGEENFFQISSRAKRLQIENPDLKILCESDIENIFASFGKEKFDLIIFDSISVIHSDEINGVSGSISQIKYIGEKITEFSKETGTASIIIGHITKDGSIAGPKTLEHLVDTVLFFEGDRFENIRILRSFKNRFGSTNEIAIFEMEENGLKDIENPGIQFLSNDKNNSIGSAIGMTLEGSRAFLVEVEALTSYTKFGYPKRSSRGIQSTKLDMILAIISKYTSIKLESSDVYVNLAKGMSVSDPSLDLAISASIISSKLGIILPKNSIFLGEVSLTGNIRKPALYEKRIKQAEKFGFKNIYGPDLEGSKIKEVTNITELEKIIKTFK